MTAPPLPDLALRAFLCDEELSLIQRADARCADAVHGLVAASPSLEARGVRRGMLLDLLRPRLSPEYEALLRTAASPPATGFGALPPSAYRWTLRATQAVPPATPAPLLDVDLLDRLDPGDWIVRAQAGRPNCVAHAVAGCVELLAARREGRFVPRSTRFVDERIRQRRRAGPPGGPMGRCGPVEAGATQTKLCEARDVLAIEGIPREKVWDEGSPPDGTFVPVAVMTEARALRPAEERYDDRPDDNGWKAGTAAVVHAELAAGRPVAVALPGFRDRALLTGPTNWDRPEVWLYGVVPDAGDDLPVPGTGHAVCVVGFQASPAEAHGGYFVFKNSWDVDFARRASRPGRPMTPPFAPRPGYGVLSATQVELHCWEFLSLRL